MVEPANGQNNQLLLIPSNIMHMVYAAGLRGAVSFSCATAFNNSNKNRFTVTLLRSTLRLRHINTCFLTGRLYYAQQL